jgi:hypothetical protein
MIRRVTPGQPAGWLHSGWTDRGAMASRRCPPLAHSLTPRSEPFQQRRTLAMTLPDPLTDIVGPLGRLGRALRELTRHSQQL